MQQKGELLFSGRNWRLLFRAGALSFSIPSWFLTSLPRLCRGFDEEHTSMRVRKHVIVLDLDSNINLLC
ncbi:Uncharacterized protein TCM_020970 [Theobroma cacao]|uniref:Uncharacterized protein n=1 Tax=Theobroma cacao TaxID=3641 RepID=A0A061EP96_THECC|nr:Uncharacterized protein TCM_020970 [Theobroma cacao]